MPRLERLGEELQVLRQLLRGMPRQGSHAERLSGFYAAQAGAYDRFRARLLGGRRELIEALPLQAGEHLVELGAGTGATLDFFPPALRSACRFTQVDLCAPLLEQARQRASGQSNITVIEADAADYRPPQQVDAVLLSYALSMMPRWSEVIDNAHAMLRLGGCIAVVDFYVSAAQAPAGQRQHGALSRRLWPRWFAHDGVMLGPQRLQSLQQRFPRHQLIETLQPVPWLPGLRVPVFRFIGHRD